MGGEYISLRYSLPLIGKEGLGVVDKCRGNLY